MRAVPRRKKSAQARPMSAARAKSLLPRGVTCTAFSRDGIQGVTLSLGIAAYDIHFTDRDALMTDAALAAIVFEPALHALKFMEIGS